MHLLGKTKPLVQTPERNMEFQVRPLSMSKSHAEKAGAPPTQKKLEHQKQRGSKDQWFWEQKEKKEVEDKEEEEE